MTQRSRASRRGGKARSRGKSRGNAGSTRPPGGWQPDPSDTDDAEVRYVQPYQALKSYLCPGCNQEIPPGQGHMVAVPPDAPDLRRHWHRGCWNNRHTRR
jgi:hypothetical protein